jgi:adenosine kinase
MGSLAATYCIEHKGPQEHSFTPDEFINRYRTNFDNQDNLDAIFN